MLIFIAFLFVCIVFILFLFHLLENSSTEATLIDSNEFSGLNIKEGTAKIVETAASNNFGGYTTKYRLRDWLVSRQRYWGAPIPMIHCPTCDVNRMFVMRYIIRSIIFLIIN